MRMKGSTLQRRTFLQMLAASSPALAFGGVPLRQGPAVVTSEASRPRLTSGIQSGDVTADRAVIWSRTDRPARMFVEYATNDVFRDARRIAGPHAAPASDFTAQIDLTGLPAGEQIVYRVWFETLDNHPAKSEPMVGRFRTAPRERPRDLLIAFGADQCQQWGINLEWGGLKIYETMRRMDPDLFIHGGDMIYADVPMQPEVMLPDGSVWKNIVTPAKSKVAQTLEDYRGNYAYNLLDENLRRFNAAVPTIAQWDDHEVMNNWYPGMKIEDKRFAVSNASTLAAYGQQAFFEYVPVLREGASSRIYRTRAYGDALEVFVLDARSYRGANSGNRQDHPGAVSAMLGAEQLGWLKRSLRESKATWKVIANDLPIGLIVADYNRPTFEGWANGDGPALGRELEIAELLTFLKQHRITNTVWLTGDVHYAAAHYYSPERAVFRDFLPFWEFVAGPLNAGTWPQNKLDNTFGPSVEFASVTADMPQNRPPTEGKQFFGTLRIDARTHVMTVALHDLGGAIVWRTDLTPSRE